MTDTTTTLEQEADLFGYYLIKEVPSEATKRLYVDAIQNSRPVINKSDMKLLRFVRLYPTFLSVVDAGLPFYKEYSEVRRRLYIMLAILEASPLHYDKFFPKKRGPLYPVFIIYVGIRAVLKALLGLLVVRLVSR